MQPRDRLIVALDRAGREEILSLADTLHDAVGIYKIGLQAFIGNGPGIIREFVSSGRRVFLDLKLHDIPNTVAGAVVAAAELGVTMLTVHAAGGRGMMEAAVRAAEGSQLRILAVTVLTSLSSSDLVEVGLDSQPEDAVRRLARLAADCGVQGVVASPLEIAAIRAACGPKFLIVTPGIRAAGDPTGDQARTLSATEAIKRGADYIVVGRPITAAHDPRSAALNLFD